MSMIQESMVRRAARAGEIIDGRDGDVRSTIDAALIRRHCMEFAAETDPRGLRIRGALVVGHLELAAVTAPFPVIFEDCEFEQPPDLDGANLHALAFLGCSMPGLIANGLAIRRDLDLSRSVITGAHKTSASTTQRAAVWLCEADIGGRLLCIGTQILGEGERAIQADRIRVGGVVRLIHGFVAHKEVRLLGAQIGGSLDLTSVQIDNPAGFALELGDAVIGGSLFIMDDFEGQPPRIRGRLDLNSAHVAGQVVIRNLALEGPTAVLPDRGYSTLDRHRMAAIMAPRFTVGAEITIEGTTIVNGGIDLSAANLGGLVVGGRVVLRNPGGTVLDLTNAEVRSSVRFGPGQRTQGRIRLTRATIHGKLDMREVSLSEPEEDVLLDAYEVQLRGAAQLQSLRADGGYLVFTSATMNFINLDGAVISNGGGQTLNMRHATVNGSVRLANFTSQGLVCLNSATIAGTLNLSGSTFTCEGVSQDNREGHALTAVSTVAQAGFNLSEAHCRPSIDLTGARTTVLVDDLSSWPPRFSISGLTYDRFDGHNDADTNPWDARRRAQWLDSADFDAGNYEQAARVFRQHGYAREAEFLLIRQRDTARRVARSRSVPLGFSKDQWWTRARHLADWAFGKTVGYGFRPGRSLITLLGLLTIVIFALQLPMIAGSLRAVDVAGNVYAADGRLVTRMTDDAKTQPDGCSNGRIRCFNPLLYGVDTVVPLISLEQRATWYVNPRTSWGNLTEMALTTATMLGWLLSTILVLSFTRLARPI